MSNKTELENNNEELQEILDTINTLPTGSGYEIVNSVDEMTDTSQSYVLASTGEIWRYQSYQTETTLTPNFTNLFDKSKVVVNKAFLIANNAAEDKNGHYLTGAYAYDFSEYDISNPSIVRIKGASGLKLGYARAVYYRYAVPTDLTTDAFRIYTQFNAHIAYSTEADGTIAFPLCVKNDGTAAHNEYALFDAFAFCFPAYETYTDNPEPITIDDVPDLIITVDEPITYTETPPQTVYDWRGTGVFVNSAGDDGRIDALEERVSALEIGSGAVAVAEETVYADFSCENDFTIVGNEIWASKNEDTYTRIVRHKIVNGTLTKLTEIKLSDVVHLNTFDYCPENDCLITGNGANDQNTTGNCFWIIPNASSLPNMSGTLSLADIAIQYNVDIGYKVQAIWGDGNLGQHNLVYLLSNDNEVRRAIIHKNADGSFANTYTIVGDAFEIEGAAGFQGVDYYGGYIYMGFGGTNFVLAKVNTRDFKAEIVEYPYCTADGTACKGVFQGVAVDRNYIWLYPNGIASGNYLVKYTK